MKEMYAPINLLFPFHVMWMTKSTPTNQSSAKTAIDLQFEFVYSIDIPQNLQLLFQSNSLVNREQMLCHCRNIFRGHMKDVLQITIGANIKLPHCRRDVGSSDESFGHKHTVFSAWSDGPYRRLRHSCAVNKLPNRAVRCHAFHHPNLVMHSFFSTFPGRPRSQVGVHKKVARLLRDTRDDELCTKAERLHGGIATVAKRGAPRADQIAEIFAARGVWRGRVEANGKLRRRG